MWFLTQEGIDRYDGKTVKHYTVLDGNMEVAPHVNLNWLYTDSSHTLWTVGRKGRVFRYDAVCDRFLMVYKFPGLQDTETATLHYACMDNNDRIWLCHGDSIVRYDIRTGTTERLNSPSTENITAFTQKDSTYFFIGTSNGLLQVREKEGVLETVTGACTDNIRTPVSELYFHTGSKKLFVGTFKEGILMYDTQAAPAVVADGTLQNVGINRIAPFGERQLLIATGGRGVYRLDVDSLGAKPYITADYGSYNGMNGNNINDIYVDEDGRIWRPTILLVSLYAMTVIGVTNGSSTRTVIAVRWLMTRCMMSFGTVRVTCGSLPVMESACLTAPQDDGGRSSAIPNA